MFKNLSPEALGISGRPSETIELALSFGFKGIELNLAEFADQVQESGLPHARRLIDSAKLKLGFFRLPLRWQEDDQAFADDLSLLAERTKLAAEVGCTRAVTWIVPGSNDRPYHQNFELTRRRLIEIVKITEPAGVQLGVGFCAEADRCAAYAFEFIRDFDALMMLVKMVPSKGIGIVFDPWQICASGGVVETALKKLVVHDIVAVQASDAIEEPPAKQWLAKNRTFPGETGKIDSVAMLVRLAELGFDGPITPSPDPARAVGQRRDSVVKTAGAQLDLVWKAAGLNPLGKLATPATGKTAAPTGSKPAAPTVSKPAAPTAVAKR